MSHKDSREELNAKLKVVAERNYDAILIGFKRHNQSLRLQCLFGHCFSVDITPYLNGQQCQVCVGASTDQVISRLNDECLRRGDRRYGRYINAHTKLPFKCSNGHVWEVTPANYIGNKSCCPTCAGSGFNPSMPGYFYYYNLMLACGTLVIGFGISNNFGKRNKEHNRNFNIASAVVLRSESVLFEDGRKALALEKEIKQSLPIYDCAIEGFRTEAILYRDKELFVKVLDKCNNIVYSSTRI